MSACEAGTSGAKMVLADGGVVCIDEFYTMQPEDRCVVAIHEAMEQQTISVAKAGITNVLNPRTSVLAAANPPSGRYDDLKTAQENIDLQKTILSRTNLIFIAKDARDYARDMISHYHTLLLWKFTVVADPICNKTLSKLHGILSMFMQLLIQLYEAQRSRTRRIGLDGILNTRNPTAALAYQIQRCNFSKKMRQQNDENKGSPVPITVRQLEAIIRISESLERMQL
uniref:DNA helicase n=2 Tax=Physcomitrium patens TaxID=3218 RepID=A0A2K1K8G4_PHYPA|nr:hypothetical protein PHYPA_011959 [Physcomitrium patens]